LISQDIVLTVVAVHGGRVCLGVEAPPEIRVERSEIRERRLAYPDGPPTKQPRAAVPVRPGVL
jgi:carbon storage regulator CsrA